MNKNLVLNHLHSCNFNDDKFAACTPHLLSQKKKRAQAMRRKWTCLPFVSSIHIIRFNVDSSAIYIQLDNFHAAFAVIIVAIKTIMPSSVPSHQRGEKKSPLISMEHIMDVNIHLKQLLSFFLTSQTRARFIAMASHGKPFQSVMIFGAVTNILFQLIFFLFNIVWYSSRTFVHTNHLVMFYCSISILSIRVAKNVIFFSFPITLPYKLRIVPKIDQTWPECTDIIKITNILTTRMEIALRSCCHATDFTWHFFRSHSNFVHYTSI